MFQSGKFRVFYPSAKIVRRLKLALAVCPFFAMIFALLFVITFVVINVDRSSLERRSSKRHMAQYSPPETLDEYVERNSVCDVMNATLTQQVLKFGDNTTITVNDTIKDICVNLTARRQLYFQPQRIRINVFDYDYVIHQKDLCRNRTDIVVLVHSFHPYFERRTSIRQTWGGAISKGKWFDNNTIEASIKLVFVMGTHKNQMLNEEIWRENQKYHDILQGSFIDDYSNMTLKSLFGLRYVGDFCAGARYLVKSDDDMIINFPYLIHLLNSTNMTRAIMGPYNSASKVYRKGKWTLTKQLYPFYYYPPYESGSAYVISSDLVNPLYQLSRYVPYLFIDDVYITGILGKILGVRHIDHAGFAFWTDKQPQPCDVKLNKVVTGTRMLPLDLTLMWNNLTKINCDTT